MREAPAVSTKAVEATPAKAKPATVKRRRPRKKPAANAKAVESASKVTAATPGATEEQRAALEAAEAWRGVRESQAAAAALALQGLARTNVPEAQEASATPSEARAAAQVRERLVAEARAILEGRKRFRDCSSFVMGVFRAAGVRVSPIALPAGRSMSESLYRGSVQVPIPRPGDIAVFDNTYDRNRDGKRNDRFTHISLVESVDGDVVTFIHRGSKGVARHRMNLRDPADPATNARLRMGGVGRVLAGQLFVGFGDLVSASEAQP